MPYQNQNSASAKRSDFGGRDPARASAQCDAARRLSWSGPDAGEQSRLVLAAEQAADAMRSASSRKYSPVASREIR